MKRTGMTIVVLTMALTGLAGCSTNQEPTGGAALSSTAVVVPAVSLVDDDDGTEPVVTHERDRVTKSIPFRSVTRKSAKLKKGVTKVAQRGRPGLRVKVFRVTLEDGLEVDRELVSNDVRRKPVTRIVLKGTRAPEPKPGRQCDPNYSGCVPIASDVDCAGGSGNGPAYVQGPVRVIGNDIYDLDYDNDGWGCE